MRPGAEAQASEPQSHWQALRWMAASRLAVALALAGFFLFETVQDDAGWLGEPKLFGRVVFVYLLAAIAFLFALRPLRGRFQLQLVVHTLVDLTAITLLMHAAGGLRGGLGVLMIATVAAAAVLSQRLLAASFAAAASLLLLGEAVLSWLRHDAVLPALSMMAGLIGAACFATAMLVNWLARQLHRQEELASERGADLRNQLAVTQRVVAELEQGVLVVAPDGRLRTMNPAARELLGGAPMGGAVAGSASTRVRAAGIGTPAAAATRAQAPDREAAGSAALATVLRACAHWREAGARSGESCELLLPSSDESGTRVQLRFLATPGGDAVLMLDDLRRAEERAQQLKLAAMGRLSASIAHEIRNPLGAIRHANALLAERLDEAASRRLAGIIEDNTLRIDRVIADVLSVSRRDRPGDETIDMPPFLAAFADEFAAQAGVDRRRIALRVEATQPMCFDPNHLRQVLVNLVGNALRYASDAPGAVVLAWRERAPHRLELRISDDGPGLSAEMRQHAFEPFFTTETRGTGLGLYLARELCSANGATVRYESASGASPGAFIIEPRAERVTA